MVARTLVSCERTGKHEIETIIALDPNDREYDEYLIEGGFNWAGICKLCKRRIYAQTKEEYKLKE